MSERSKPDIVLQLEDFIYRGYGIIEKLEKEYSVAEQKDLSGLISEYHNTHHEWIKHVVKNLPNDIQQKTFSMTRSTSALYEVGKSSAVQNIVKDIRAKIDKLEDFKKEHQLQPSVKIEKMGKQARVTFGDDKSVNISGDINVLVNDLELEFKNNYKGEDREETLKLVDSLKKEVKTGNKEKAKKILGTLLSRGAEIATISNLIIQALQLL